MEPQKSVDFNKSVYDLCTGDPEILAIMSLLGFSDITMPGMLQTAGRFMTIPKGAALKKIELDKIKQVFLDHGYQVKG